MIPRSASLTLPWRGPNVKPDDKEQSKLFIEKAREIEADEKHSAADKLMERLAKTKPEPRKGK
jgi:hypothetical protein